MLFINFECSSLLGRSFKFVCSLIMHIRHLCKGIKKLKAKEEVFLPSPLQSRVTYDWSWVRWWILRSAVLSRRLRVSRFVSFGFSVSMCRQLRNYICAASWSTIVLRAARPGPGAGIEDELGMPSMWSWAGKGKRKARLAPPICQCRRIV